MLLSVNFVNKIKIARAKRQLTQKQLGKLVGVSDNQIHRWENGNTKPNLKSLMRLSEVLEIDIEELLKAMEEE